MLVRTAHISFGSMAVFPGGVCDPEDRVYCPLKDFENYGKLTAVRELYEETGILLLPPNIDHHQLASRRIPDG